MRKKEYLTKPNLSIKEYQVKDFPSITDYFINVELKDREVLGKNITLKYICSQVGGMLKAYNIDNRSFFYFKNKGLYELVNYSLKVLFYASSQPLLTDVIINGEQDILVIESSSAYNLTKKKTFNFPYGTCIAKYDGRIFVANKKNIYYSNAFNFTEYSTDIKNEGFLSIDDADVSIENLISFNDCMYVVCKKAIYKLTISGGQFSFNKLEIDHIDVLAGSAKNIGRNIYFISKGSLYVFNGNECKVIKGEFDRFLRTAVGEASVIDGKYFIKIPMGDQNVLLVYDTFTGENYYVWMDQLGTVGENGYVYMNKHTTLYQLDRNTNYQTFVWVSKELNLSTSNRKKLVELGLTVNKPMELTIEGDFGVKKFMLKEGINVLKEGLTSRWFKLRAQLRFPEFSIKDLIIKYRVLGG